MNFNIALEFHDSKIVKVIQEGSLFVVFLSMPALISEGDRWLSNEDYTVAVRLKFEAEVDWQIQGQCEIFDGTLEVQNQKSSVIPIDLSIKDRFHLRLVTSEGEFTLEGRNLEVQTDISNLPEKYLTGH